jgi:hypothetical protein
MFKPSQNLKQVNGFKIFDSNGNEIEYQILNRDTKYSLVWGYYEYPHQILVDRFKILLDVKKLSPFGWKRIDIIQNDSFPVYEKKVGYGTDEYGCIYIENQFLKVKFNETGSIKIIDKERGFEFDNLKHI